MASNAFANKFCISLKHTLQTPSLTLSQKVLLVRRSHYLLKSKGIDSRPKFLLTSVMKRTVVFTAPRCWQSFSQLASCRRHFKEIHMHTKPLLQHLCGKVFYQKRYLEYRKTYKHGGKKRSDRKPYISIRLNSTRQASKEQR